MAHLNLGIKKAYKISTLLKMSKNEGHSYKEVLASPQVWECWRYSVGALAFIEDGGIMLKLLRA